MKLKQIIDVMISRSMKQGLAAEIMTGKGSIRAER
jgi:hypothetical protein